MDRRTDLDRVDRWLFNAMVLASLALCIAGVIEIARADTVQALVIRYYSIGGGPLLSAQVSYGWEPGACAAKKIEVDAQPDPKGMKTIIDCVEEADIAALLARGDRV